MILNDIFIPYKKAHIPIYFYFLNYSIIKCWFS